MQQSIVTLRLKEPMRSSMTPGTRILCLFLFMLAGLFIAGLILPLLLFILGLDRGGRGAIYIGAVLQSTLAFILPAYYAVKLGGFSPSKYMQLKSDATMGKKITFGILVFIFSYACVSFLNQWNKGIVLPESLQAVEEWMRALEDSAIATTNLLLSSGNVWHLMLNLLIVAALAAISEEIFFRGALQQFLQERKLSGHAAVWTTALLFSVVHFQFYGFFPRLVLGALLGYLFLYTQNLWIPIIVHFINNAMVIVLSFFWGDSEWMEGLEEAEITLSFIIMAILSTLFTLLLFMSYRRKNAIIPSNLNE